MRSFALLLALTTPALADVAAPERLRPAIDLATVARGAPVFDDSMVLGAVDPRWVSGAPHLEHAGSTPATVVWPIDAARLPPAVRALRARKFRVYHRNGETCEAEVYEFQAAARVIDQYRGEPAIVPPGLFERAARERVLVARLVAGDAGCGHGVFARSTALPAPAVRRAVPVGDQADVLFVEARRAGETAALTLVVEPAALRACDERAGSTTIAFADGPPERIDGLAITWAAAVDLDGDGADELVYQGARDERGILGRRRGGWVRLAGPQATRFCDP